MKPNPDSTSSAPDIGLAASEASGARSATASTYDEQLLSESKAAFLRGLSRRLTLLAKEVKGLAGRSDVQEDELSDGAARLLEELSKLGRQLVAARPVGDDQWELVREELRARWRRLRQSFEELALACGRSYGTGSRRGGQRPKW